MEITYANKTIKGQRAEVFKKLRAEPYNLTYAEIGGLPEVQLSKQRVHKITQEHFDISGHVDYLSLYDKELYSNYTDEEISEMYKVSVYKVKKTRLELNIRRSKQYTTLPKRRDYLCNYIFGDKYLPGNNFVTFIYSKTEHLPPKQQEIIEKYYLIGEPYSNDTERSYCSRARVNLKRIINGVNHKKLIKEEVIVENN